MKRAVTLTHDDVAAALQPGGSSASGGSGEKISANVLSQKYRNVSIFDLAEKGEPKPAQNQSSILNKLWNLEKKVPKRDRNPSNIDKKSQFSSVDVRRG